MNNDMINRGFSEMEISAISEILNISMGSAATAIANLLGLKADISVPDVSMKPVNEIRVGDTATSIGIKVNYLKGLEGSSVMILSKNDVRAIANQMTGGMAEPVDANEELDDMSISAISEMMNQMMGSSSTALSSFLNIDIEVSSPTVVTLDDGKLPPEPDGIPQGEAILAKFQLDIDGLVNNEFVNVLSADLARKIVATLLGSLYEDSAASETVEAAPVAATQAESPSMMVRSVSEEVPPQQTQVVAPNVATSGNVIHEPMEAKPIRLPSFDEVPILGGEQQENLNLIMSVPLQITVEIGKTSRKIKEILEFTQGSVVELDKLAGDQVDILANGQLIAKGDVVVIGDNFGVRINEIIKNKAILGL